MVLKLYVINRVKSNIINSMKYKSFAAILTAVTIEKTYVMKLYDNWEKMTLPSDEQEYFITSFESGDKSRKIITASQNLMGMTAAALLSSKVIYNFRPKYLIMCGIAAGVGREIEQIYGDIIIPDVVWDASAGKFTSPEKAAIRYGNVGFEPRPRALYLDKAVKEKIISLADNTEFKINIGTMACGSYVIANSEVLNKQIYPQFPSTIGLDMESYGVFYSAEYSSHPRPKAIIIKGICDYADEDKSGKYQKFASYNSSMLTKYLIENVLD